MKHQLYNPYYYRKHPTKSDEVASEINPHIDTLVFLYKNPLGRLLRVIARRPFMGSLMGWLYDTRWSKRFIEPFIKSLAIATDELEKPVEAYRTFNEFFSRKLKPGTRIIEGPATTLSSPADGKLLVVDDVSTTATFFVKKRPFDLPRVLSDSILADQFTGCTLLMFRLAPPDYHRFHFPADGTVILSKRISGYLESVNPLVFKFGYQPLTTNERHLVLLQTEHFGVIAIIIVGAMMVGSINLTFDPMAHHRKGDEMGYFAFGGSTVIVLIKQGLIIPSDTFLRHSLQGFETEVRMGEAVN